MPGLNTSKYTVGSKAAGLGTLNSVDATNSFPRGTVIQQHSDDGAAALVLTYKSRGTQASPAAVQSGDYLSTYAVQAHDGTAYRTIGMLGFRATDDAATNEIPGEWFLSAQAEDDADPYTNDHVIFKGKSAGVELLKVPTAPTAAPNTDTTQLATTEFVQESRDGWFTITDFSYRYMALGGSAVAPIYSTSFTDHHWAHGRTGLTEAQSGDWWEYQFSCRAGTYRFARMGCQLTNAGICTYDIDGVNVETDDWYGSTDYVSRREDSITISTSGQHTLRITCTGKNGSSSGNYLIFGIIGAVRTGA